jgi:diaminopimelate decarboxylase
MNDGARRPLDDCLSVRDGRLFIEECDAGELARRFGTPCYVVSEDQLRRNVRRFQLAFAKRWPEGPVRVLPSIKANFTLALLRILAQEGTGFDTFGPSELHAALGSGADPALVSVNGSSKDRRILEAAVRAGARVTLDSAAEAKLLRQVAKDLGVRPKARFRLRPRYEGLDDPSDFYEDETSVRMAALQYKPGIPAADLKRIGKEMLSAPEVEVTGVMAHLGRHSTNLAVWRGMVRSLVDLIAELSEAWGGWEPREIDLGGGYATRRDPTGRTTPRGARRPPEDLAPSIEEYADALAGTLRSELALHGMTSSGKILEVEPGRSLFADTGIHLTTVRNLKSQDEPIPWRWIETDTTEMFLLDGLVEHNRWTPIVANKAASPSRQTADVVGISCGFDVIVHQVSLPEVEPGDVIAFLDTGAYQDACSNNFNGLPRPATVLVHGSLGEIVKRAETVEDVFRRDSVPPRLAVPTRAVTK